MVPGLVIDLLADLHAVTGDEEWYDDALSIATVVLDSYLDTTLPRGATGIDRYESQLGTGHLLHALARIGWMDDGADPVGPNYAER